MAKRVTKALAEHGIDFDLVEHPHSGSTHESAEAAHVSDDHIAKAVIAKDSEGFVMIVVPGGNWVEMDALRGELNRELRLATEEEIADLFADCEPGAVPPLGAAYGLETLLDDGLASLADVYFEAGDHEELVRVKGKDFQELMRGARHGFYSRED